MQEEPGGARRSQDRQDLPKEAGARRSQNDSKITTGVARRGQGGPAGARSRQDSKSCRRSQEDSQIMSRAARRRPFYLFVWGDEVGNKRTELVSFSIFFTSLGISSQVIYFTCKLNLTKK